VDVGSIGRTTYKLLSCDCVRVASQDPEEELAASNFPTITTLKREGATPPPALNELALRFFEPLRPGKDKLEEHVLKTNQKHPHLLALFQSTFHNSQGNLNASVQTPKSSRPTCDNQSKSVKKPVVNTNRLHPHLRHLLDLFQSIFRILKCLLPKRENLSENEKISRKGWVHNATTLTYAGVRFKKKVR
jgi:hypothetical protein